LYYTFWLWNTSPLVVYHKLLKNWPRQTSSQPGSTVPDFRHYNKSKPSLPKEMAYYPH